MKNLLIFISALTASTAFADNLNANELKDVQGVIKLFKNKNITAISNNVVYPYIVKNPSQVLPMQPR